MRELADNLEQLMKNGQAEDKFGFLDSLGRGHLFSYHQMVQKVHEITTDPETHFTECDFAFFLLIVKEHFGQDLEAFASGEVSHDAKLQAYLSKSLKNILSKKLPELVKVPYRKEQFEDGVARIITFDLDPKHTEAELIEKAQRMDMAHDEFDARAMLRVVEGVDYGKFGMERPSKSTERLVKTVKRICGGMVAIYGGPLLAYTWARLMAPDELAGLSQAPDLHRLAEYWRVCLPVNNLETRDQLVFENFKRNMSLKERIKKMF